jgi:hypothetical protein
MLLASRSLTVEGGSYRYIMEKARLNIRDHNVLRAWDSYFEKFCFKKNILEYTA